MLQGKTDVSNYPKWELESLKDEEHPLLPYNMTEDYQQHVYVPAGKTEESTGNVLQETADSVTLEGRLIGGCVDCLVTLAGTEFDQTKKFLEKYQSDGFLWFLECCDLTPMDMRRAFFNMKHAGWFKYVKGFLIGRPLHFQEEMLGLDRFSAVLDVLKDFGVPVLMDLDIGHLPPQMPLISGSYARVTAEDNKISVEHIFK